MVEAVGIPLLLKAVDFLFEEGKKILQEIRTRRKSSTDAEPPSEDTEKPIMRDDVIMSKDSALSQIINENSWLDSEKEIEHLLRLLELVTRRYRLAKEQFESYGRADVPPITVNRLIEAEKGIEENTKKLQDAMSKVYGKKIILSKVDE